MMFRLGLLTLLIGAIRAQSPTPIEGIVTDSCTGEPLRKAHLTLIGTGPDDLKTVSGSNGHFVFPHVAPCDCTIHVERKGFLDLDHRVAEPAGIQLTLTRAAAMSGRVVDADGHPPQMPTSPPTRSEHSSDGPNCKIAAERTQVNVASSEL